MKKAAISLLFVIVPATAILIARAASERTLVFTHVNLIDATGAPLRPDMTVVVVGKRITDIEKSSGANIPKNAQVLNAQGKYLIPGLWDMHVHEIFGDWLPENEKVIPLLFVANGITTHAHRGRR
jgi:imidazolonepropionase-like amidohydrolase